MILRRGDSLRVLRDLARETGATAVHFSRRYEPAAAARDSIVTEALRNTGVTVRTFASALLFEPEALRTGAGGPYKVFTPFWKALQALPSPPPPLGIPRLRNPPAWPESSDIRALGLLPKTDWAAGMRSAWTPGWKGARWFWDTLVDADLAQNTLGWQWVAGCGADAAPYFRIFNPVTQGEKTDPEGAYVRRWAPELAKLPTPWIHWEAPESALRQAGVALGKDYPLPLAGMPSRARGRWRRTARCGKPPLPRFWNLRPSAALS